MGAVLDACIEVTGAGPDGASATLRWIDPERLLAAGVMPWIELPLWIPRGHEHRWLQELDVERAHAAGLRCRAAFETVADTWRWLQHVGVVPPRAGRPSRGAVGLDPAKEAELLAST